MMYFLHLSSVVTCLLLKQVPELGDLGLELVLVEFLVFILFPFIFIQFEDHRNVLFVVFEVLKLLLQSSIILLVVESGLIILGLEVDNFFLEVSILMKIQNLKKY